MEGKEGALDAEPDGHQRNDDRQGPVMRPVRGKRPDGVVQVFHQQMPRQIIEQHQTQQKEPGADQIQHHIADGRGEAGPGIPEGNQRAGAERHDFQKHIAGKQIVGINLGQEGRHQQHADRVIQVLPAGGGSFRQRPASRGQRAEHDQRKQACADALQHPGADLVAPGSGEMPHPEDEGPRTGAQQAGGQRRRPQDAQEQHAAGQMAGDPAGQQGAGRGGQQAEQDGKEGKILPPEHGVTPPPFGPAG